MVIYEGQPIYYYHPYGTSPSRDLVPFYQSDSSSSFSVQSDSDCSEIPQRPVRNQTVIRHTSPNKFQCRWKTCGTIFESLDQLADHVSKAHASSGLGGLFYCEWEGCSRNCKGFNARYKMLVHVRTHTNEKPHVCSQCHKSFSRAENLKIHSRSHSGEKPYVCPVAGCNKAYSNSSDRFKHTRTHQVEKPYKCKVAGCNKRYTDPSSLRKHVKTYRHSEEIGPNAISGIRERNESISSTCSSSSSNDDEINEDYHSIGRRVLHSECSSISSSCDSDFEPLDLRVIKSRVENLSMW